MRLSFPISVLAGALLAAAPSQAQSIYGPGGLFLNPTADFAPKGTLTPAAIYIPQESGGQKFALYSVSANYAVSDKAEAGVTYLKMVPGSMRPDGSFGGSFKYRLQQGRGWKPTIAAGANVLAGGDINQRTAFLAAKFTPDIGSPKHPVSFHAGMMYANQIWNGRSRDIVPYVGATYRLTKGVTAFAEWRDRMNKGEAQAIDTEAPKAIGIILEPNDDYKIALAYANNGHSTKMKPSIGVGFTLGSRRTTGGAK